MRNPMQRLVLNMLGLGVLLTVLGLILAACGSEADKPGDKKTATGRQESQIDLPRFPPAPSDAENPRLRGSQGMTLEELVVWAIVDADAKWQGAFAAAGLDYRPVGWNIFSERPVESPVCGVVEPTDSASYCGGSDQTVYYPLEWAAYGNENYGDFAVATSAGHEMGHHVQAQLGIDDLHAEGVYTTRQTELQADCFSGVWAYSAYSRDLLEEGDIEEAMRWRYDLGDVPGTSSTDPDAHGSPEERLDAFLAGYQNGDPGPCLDYTPLPEETTG
jgi:predicted metalloprotease